MKNYLISEAIGDIAGSAYEGRAHRIKDYNKVKMFSSTALSQFGQWIRYALFLCRMACQNRRRMYSHGA